MIYFECEYCGTQYTQEISTCKQCGAPMRLSPKKESLKCLVNGMYGWEVWDYETDKFVRVATPEDRKNLYLYPTDPIKYSFTVNKEALSELKRSIIDEKVQDRDALGGCKVQTVD